MRKEFKLQITRNIDGMMEIANLRDHPLMSPEYRYFNKTESSLTSRGDAERLFLELATSSYDSVDQLQCLIDAGIDVNKRVDGHHPLIKAIEEGADRYNIETLLQNGANVNYKDALGLTPIVAAVKKNEKEIVSLLIGSGSNLNDLSANGKSILMLACSVNNIDIDIVREILRHTLADINKADKEGNTALHYASLKGSDDLVSLLIDFGADVNAVNQKKDTPLHVSINDECEKKVKLLLGSGADVNAKNKFGQTPLMDSVITSKNIAIQRILLKNNADVNITDCFGRTAFVHALSFNEFSVLQTLIDANIDLDLPDVNGMTPLMHLALNPHSHFYILKNVAKLVKDINAVDDEGRSALSYALMNSHRENAEMLLEFDVNVELVDIDGNTAIDYARWDDEICARVIATRNRNNAIDSIDNESLVNESKRRGRSCLP